MKKLLAIIGIATLLGSCAKSTPEEEKTAYLMVYHKDQTHSLHMAVSRDGYTFTALNDGDPIIAGDTIADQKGIRDPHIYRGPDGSFYLSMTDLHIGGQRAGYRDSIWERSREKYGWGNNRGLVLMKSKDLINWSRSNIRVSELDSAFAEIGCAWAPETIWDEEKGKPMVYFTMRFGTQPEKLYYAYTDEDYTRFETLPEVLFAYPDEKFTVIDGDITHVGDKYHLMYVPNDGVPGIKHAVADRLTGPYEYLAEFVDTATVACEAPNVWKRIGEDKWVLMYDCYGKWPSNFGFLETTDFVTFTPIGDFNQGEMKTTNFRSPKHGAVVHITESEAQRLENYYNKKS